MSVIDGQWSVTDGRELGIENARDRRFVLSRQADGGTAMVAKVWSDGDGYEDTARLVAAAPELLAALKDAMWTVGHLWPDKFDDPEQQRCMEESWERWEQAQAKAEGRLET